MNTADLVMRPVIGAKYVALKTVAKYSVRKGGIYLLDRPYSDSPYIMLIKDPKGGPGKGRSTMLLNGMMIVAEGLREGWLERSAA